MGQADDAITYALAQKGKPYVFGTAGPDTFDCSGLVRAAYLHANPPVNLIHYTNTMVLQGKEVPLSDIQPGDLVFPSINHVQLYIGDNQVIEAPNQSTPVQVVTIGNVWHLRRVTTDGQQSKGIPTGALGDANLAVNVNGIPSPLTALEAGTKLLANLINPQFWLRVGAVGFGLGVILIGLIVLFRRQEIALAKAVGGTVVQTATSIAGGVAESTAITKAANRVSAPLPSTGLSQGGTHTQPMSTGRPGAPGGSLHPYLGRHARGD